MTFLHDGKICELSRRKTIDTGKEKRYVIEASSITRNNLKQEHDEGHIFNYCNEVSDRMSEDLQKKVSDMEMVLSSREKSFIPDNCNPYSGLGSHVFNLYPIEQDRILSWKETYSK